jgi:uncharacterized protein (TIGR03643 family)
MQALTEDVIDRIVEMAWEDRTSFDGIFRQFGVSESEVIAIMRREMHPHNFKKWRARVQGRNTKHEKLRADEVRRFHSRMQRVISGNRKSK